MECRGDDIELASIVWSTFQAIEKLEIVDRVVVEGENTMLVEFNALGTWDSIIKPMKVALDHFCVVAGYESVGSKGERYKIVPNDSKEVEVHPKRKKDFEVENLETLEGRPNWIAVIRFKPSLREKVSFHESESKAKRWLLNHIRDLPYRSRREDAELSMALVARQTAEYKEIDLPPDAERILYCEDCRRFLLNGPERTACKLAGHNMVGKNGAKLYRAGKKMFFQVGEFTDRLVQNTSTKVVHALAIDEVYCSAECSDFSEEVDLDGARLCKQCKRKIVE